MGFWWDVFKREWKEKAKYAVWGDLRILGGILIFLLGMIVVSLPAMAGVGEEFIGNLLIYGLLVGSSAFLIPALVLPLRHVIEPVVRFAKMSIDRLIYGNVVAYYSNTTTVIPIHDIPLSNRGLDSYIKVMMDAESSPLVDRKTDIRVPLRPFSSRKNYRMLVGLIAKASEDGAVLDINSLEYSLQSLQDSNAELLQPRASEWVEDSAGVIFFGRVAPILMALFFQFFTLHSLHYRNVYNLYERSCEAVAEGSEDYNNLRRCLEYVDDAEEIDLKSYCEDTELDDENARLCKAYIKQKLREKRLPVKKRKLKVR